MKEYTEEFKQESAKLAIKSDCSVDKTAQNLGVSSTALRNWIKKYSSGSVKEKANSMELEIKQFDCLATFVINLGHPWHKIPLGLTRDSV